MIQTDNKINTFFRYRKDELMANQDFSKIGAEIKNALTQAVDTGDFSRLNSAISHTVDSAVKEMQERVGKTIKSSYAPKSMPDSEYKNEYRRSRQEQCSQGTVMKSYEVLYGKVPGRISSVLFTVFGSILTAGFGIPFLVLLAISIGTASFGVLLRLAMFFFLPLTAGSLAMLGIGIKQTRRKNRFQDYLKCIGTKTICAIKTLSRAVGKSEKYVYSDLQKMIQMGLFRQGHIDDEKTCLMVTDETYDLYQQSKLRTFEAQKEYKKEQERLKEEEIKDSRLKEVLAEGLRCIEIIRKVNDDLPEPVISAKLDKLEKVIGLIYVRLQKSPEKLDSMKRFTDYYLPTTIKLVKAYREFDQSRMESGRIAAAQKEIEQTLDTINMAFERMLDTLYEDDTMDISSDIQVLQMLLAQEGLTDDGMRSMDDVFEGISGVRKL